MIRLVDRLVEESGRVRYQTVFSGAAGGSGGELSLSDDIVNRLLRLQRMITELVTVDDHEEGLSVSEQIQVNCQLAYFNKLATAAQRFQSSQRAILQSTPHSPQSDTTWATEHSPPHTAAFLLQQDFDSLRHQEYESILNSMRAVSALSKHMHLMVAHQGGLLDRIDYNLEHAQQQTRAAVAVIHERGDKHDLDKRKLVILFLVIMIIVLTTAVILKPPKH